MKDKISGLMFQDQGASVTNHMNCAVFCVYTSDGKRFSRYLTTDMNDALQEFKRMMDQKDRIPLKHLFFEIMYQGNMIYYAQSIPFCE